MSHGPSVIAKLLVKEVAGQIRQVCNRMGGRLFQFPLNTSLKCPLVDQSTVRSQNDGDLHAFTRCGTSPDVSSHLFLFPDYFRFRKLQVYKALATSYTLSVCLAMTAVADIIVKGRSCVVFGLLTTGKLDS